MILFKMVHGLDFSVSYTTRPSRGSEKDGKEYFFVTEAEFKAMIAANEFSSMPNVFGNYYGTSRHFLQTVKPWPRPSARYRRSGSCSGEKESPRCGEHLHSSSGPRQAGMAPPEPGLDPEQVIRRRLDTAGERLRIH